jgi:hypothetical protein
MYNGVSRNGGHIISAGSRLCEVYPMGWIMRYCRNLTRLLVTINGCGFQSANGYVETFHFLSRLYQWCTPSFHGIIIDIQFVSVAYGLRQ